MSYLKITPGPWEVDETDGKTITAAVPNSFERRLIAIFRDRDDAKAGAVVPELIEALQALPLAAFDVGVGTPDAADFVDHAQEFYVAMELGRAALRKAGVVE